jgi:hypothetical protein
MPWVRINGRRRFVEPLAVDDDPRYRVEVNEDGTLDHTVAYDPGYEEPCDTCGTLLPVGQECESCG